GQGRGRRDSGSAERGGRVPDRGVEERGQPRRSEGLRRVRALARGPRDPGALRLRGAVNRAPRWALVPALCAGLLIIGPLAALLVRTPWSEVPHQLASPAARDALSLSLFCSLAA